MYKSVFLIFLFINISSAFSQDTNTYYKCSNCENPLFSKDDIVENKEQHYLVHYNKAENTKRKKEETKDVHCTHCDSHIGYSERDDEAKILPNRVHKEHETYNCSICNKPLFTSSQLKEETEDNYTFTVINNKEVAIINRSYILDGKYVYCSFCYQQLGKKYKSENLKLDKIKLIAPN